MPLWMLNMVKKITKNIFKQKERHPQLKNNKMDVF